MERDQRPELTTQQIKRLFRTRTCNPHDNDGPDFKIIPMTNEQGQPLVQLSVITEDQRIVYPNVLLVRAILWHREKKLSVLSIDPATQRLATDEYNLGEASYVRQYCDIPKSS